MNAISLSIPKSKAHMMSLRLTVSCATIFTPGFRSTLTAKNDSTVSDKIRRCVRFCSLRSANSDVASGSLAAAAPRCAISNAETDIPSARDSAATGFTAPSAVLRCGVAEPNSLLTRIVSSMRWYALTSSAMRGCSLDDEDDDEARYGPRTSAAAPAPSPRPMRNSDDRLYPLRSENRGCCDALPTPVPDDEGSSDNSWKLEIKLGAKVAATYRELRDAYSSCTCCNRCVAVAASFVKDRSGAVAALCSASHSPNSLAACNSCSHAQSLPLQIIGRKVLPSALHNGQVNSFSPMRSGWFRAIWFWCRCAVACR